MSAAKPAIEAERTERQDVTNRFFAGVREGDVHLLLGMLAPDALAYVDTRQTPTVGRRAVASLLDRLSNDLALRPEQILLEVGDGLVQTVRWAERRR